MTAVHKVCVLLLGDEKQFRDYKLFKGDLEEQANGNLNIEDFRDINNADGGAGDIGEKLRRFLEARDAVIVVCSAKMKSIVEHRHVVDIKLYGKHMKLDGNVLNECFSRDEIRKKVVLVSLEDEEKESAGDLMQRVPHMLMECHYFNINNDDVFDQVISSIIAM